MRVLLDGLFAVAINTVFMLSILYLLEFEWFRILTAVASGFVLATCVWIALRTKRDGKPGSNCGG